MKCLKKKIIMVPYPAQGHVTPMLKLGEAFLSHGFNCDLSIILPKSIHKRIAAHVDAATLIIPMNDGLDEGAPPPDFFAIEKAMEDEVPNQLRRILHDLKEEDGNDNNGVLMIVDLLASWAIEVGNECGVQVAGFWPAMLATYRLIASIPNMVGSGLISESGLPEDQQSVCYLSCELNISATELPWVIGNSASIRSRFKFWIRTFERSRKLKHLLVNSFPNEHCTQHDMEKDQSRSRKSPEVKINDDPIVYPIGPLSKLDQINRTPSFWEEDMSCLEWLDKQKDSSIIYVSFGSCVSSIGEVKLKKLAVGLVESGYQFLWVLRPSWRQGLSSKLLTSVSKLGKLVSWAPQVDVLKHKAVGCYLTHCGWNSTMEAIQCQKRLLCYPVAGDQFVNCAYIVDVWKIGVRIDGVGRKSLTEVIKRVMEDSEMANRLMILNAKTTGGNATTRIMESLKGFFDGTMA